MAQDYSGRTVVVTGGGSGLGIAMADAFAAQGADIALIDIDGARAEEKAVALQQAGTPAIAIGADVADRDAMDAAAARVRERFGAISVFCANVGVQQFGAIDTLSPSDWDWVFDVNVKGVINGVDAFLPLIREAQDCPRHIVITSSASYFQPAVRMAAYIASKYAVTGYGEVLRQELAGEGINVALLFPGGMTTRHIQSSAAARPKAIGEYRLDPADIEAMKQAAGITMEGHVVSAEHAVRNLLADLEAGEPYIITHGDYRATMERRAADQLAAFDRMRANPCTKQVNGRGS